MFKNKIFKHFFLEYFKIFLVVTLSLSILIWVTQAARLLELITEYGNPPKIYIKYILLGYPKVLDNIFLFCFVISMFFTLNKLKSSKELSIYWLSGISKDIIISLIIKISFLAIIINILISAFIAPMSSNYGRTILSNSKFSLVNSLVKENNFNSPLKGLTIYVQKNDKIGNLSGVFIYEKNRTIIAKRGEVLSDKESYFLKLYDGVTYEKATKNINTIKFENTIFDFSNYQLQNTTYPKFTERSNIWLIEKIKSKDTIYKINEIREELNKRLIKPFFILVLCIISSFLLCSQLNLNKKNLIYLSSVILLVLNQIMLNLSGQKIIYSYFYFLLIFFTFLILYYFLKNSLKSELK